MGKLTKICVVTALLVSLAHSSAFAMFVGPGGDDFTYLGTDPTKWEPGPDTASFHPFVPPAGPRTPGGATFSIMPAGLGDATGWDTAHGTVLTSDITALGVPGYVAADYAADISAALDVWASACWFTNLGQVADGGAAAGASDAAGGNLGDIRVAAWQITSPGVLAHGYQPGEEGMGGAGWNLGGDVHFDIDWTWVDDPDDVAGNGQYDFFTVALHELGHNLGLGHEDAIPGAVMYPFYSGARRTLHPDDIAGIQALYGVPAPGAILLGSIGVSLVGWLRRRKTL